MSPPISVRTLAIPSAIRSQLARYGLAIVFVVLAIALRAWLHPVMGHRSVAIFMAGILAGAWVGGVGPALVSLIVLHGVHGYWFETPPGLGSLSVSSIVGIGGYYVVGITVGVLSQMRAAAQRRASAEHIEAASQREHLHATLSCMADGVIVTDANGQLTLMNRAAETLTGWSMADANGKPWWEVFVLRCEESGDGMESPISQVVQESRVVHGSQSLILTSRTGQSIPVAYSAAPVQSIGAEVTGAVLVFRDESERRRAELALQNADRRKDEFLATLAHELRNPLAPICMGLELLALSADDRQAAEEIRSMMQRQAEHMVRLIDDLLDVSRITRGKLELRKSRAELADIVRDAVAAARPLLDAAKHQLTVRLPDKPLLLYADTNRLTQVLTNLLNNAAKFTPHQGHIELIAGTSGSEVTISVADSGVGIPAEKIDRVFEMFTQIHESTEYGDRGLGIGLGLVKRLVELHGGSVEAQSRGRNQGTTVVVRLPVFPEPPAPAGGAPGDSPGATIIGNRRILVVDDNVDALESLSRLVALMGNNVRQARDGFEALHIARSFQPDIVLMDLGMPNLNGYDAARLIRQEAWGRDLSLVATTGWGQDDDRRRSAEAGFDHHLVKPVALAELRAVLSEPVPVRRSIHNN